MVEGAQKEAAQAAQAAFSCALRAGMQVCMHVSRLVGAVLGSAQ